jgi:hypothetical protein
MTRSELNPTVVLACPAAPLPPAPLLAAAPLLLPPATGPASSPDPELPLTLTPPLPDEPVAPGMADEPPLLLPLLALPPAPDDTPVDVEPPVVVPAPLPPGAAPFPLALEDEDDDPELFAAVPLPGAGLLPEGPVGVAALLQPQMPAPAMPTKRAPLADLAHPMCVFI